MKKFLILIILSLIIFNPIISQADKLIDIEELIINSIKEEPEHWGIGPLYLYRCSDPNYITQVTFADVSDYTDIAIRYDIFDVKPYIVIKKPIKRKVEGTNAEELDRIIKTILYNKLKRELKIKDEEVIVQKAEPKSEVKKIKNRKF